MLSCPRSPAPRAQGPEAGFGRRVNGSAGPAPVSIQHNLVGCWLVPCECWKVVAAELPPWTQPSGVCAERRTLSA